MEKDWRAYCLMSSIIYIEEMTKPNEHTQIKNYKNKKYNYLCFHSISLKMKDLAFTQRFFKITKKWENKKKIKFIGNSFNEIRKDPRNGQYYFYLSPLWMNWIISECGKIPNAYTLKTSVKRIRHLKQYKKIPINFKKDLFKLLLNNKKLAAGAFVVSMDLECRGVQQGSVSLCMSEKYKDFLNTMLKIAKKWRWTNNEKLSSVKVDNSIKLGINASPQYEFRITINGLKEIYKLAGPLANTHKDKCIKFHIKRSNNYVNSWEMRKKANTREKILKAVKKNKNLTTTDLQFIAGVRVDVILDHLHKLEKQEKVIKNRKGKRYIWNIK